MRDHQIRKFMSKRKIPFSEEQHEEFAKDLHESMLQLFEWINKFGESYSVNGKQYKCLSKLLKEMSRLRFDKMHIWYINHSQEDLKTKKCPYETSEKRTWIAI